MQLIIISNPSRIVDEQEIVNELLLHGMDIFHLRKPEWSFEEMDEYLSKINKEFHSRIVIHSNYELCNKYNLKGIHFTGMTKDLIPQYTDCNIHKSISCHSIEEIHGLTERFNYIFLSPFFDSLSKKGYKSSFDINELKTFCEQNPNKIVAMGGISPENIEKISDFNLYGMAALGFVWQNDSKEKIISAFNELLSMVNHHFK